MNRVPGVGCVQGAQRMPGTFVFATDRLNCSVDCPPGLPGFSASERAGGQNQGYDDGSSLHL